MSDEDPEKGETAEEGTKQKSGMGQGAKDDIGVCVVIILITVLAIIVTVIKIILFDVNQYPELFGDQTDKGSGDSGKSLTTASPTTASGTEAGGGSGFA